MENDIIEVIAQFKGHKMIVKYSNGSVIVIEGKEECKKEMKRITKLNER